VNGVTCKQAALRGCQSVGAQAIVHLYCLFKAADNKDTLNKEGEIIDSTVCYQFHLKTSVERMSHTLLLL